VFLFLFFCLKQWIRFHIPATRRLSKFTQLNQVLLVVLAYLSALLLSKSFLQDVTPSTTVQIFITDWGGDAPDPNVFNVPNTCYSPKLGSHIIHLIDDFLNQSVQHLPSSIFGCDFNRSVDHLPSSITQLTLGRKFNQWDIVCW